MGDEEKTPTVLVGDGLFSTEDAFAAYLSQVGNRRPHNESYAFVARNFLLDEGIRVGREKSYRESGAAADHSGEEQWRGSHEAYLKAQVFLPSDGHGAPTKVDPTDDFSCPETFRDFDPASPYLDADEQLDLVRLVDLSFIAREAAEAPEGVLELAREAAASPLDSAVRARFDPVLRRWAAQCDLRPVFVSFWEDMQDLFGAISEEDKAGWADELRDRCGLSHFDPDRAGGTRSPINVAVFRYCVREVPRILHFNRRGLIPPTVLDGRHHPAFCPAPRDLPSGHTIDLSGSTSLPRREVLHPALGFTSRQLWRVGTITRPVDLSCFDVARGLHLQALRDESKRSGYAAGTDSDLL